MGVRVTLSGIDYETRDFPEAVSYAVDAGGNQVGFLIVYGQADDPHAQPKYPPVATFAPGCWAFAEITKDESK